MGAAPKTVNYRGDVLSDEMLDYLYGGREFGIRGTEGDVTGTGRGRGRFSAERTQEILANWMFGIKPRAINPGLELARASSLSGTRERESAGTGIAGLFGYGKSIGDLPPLPVMPGLDAGGMAGGVPYSVPPLPKLRPVGGR